MPQFQKLKELLEKNYTWPALYTFKFIILKETEVEFKKVIGLDLEGIMIIDYKVRVSGQGKYLAFTFSMKVESSEKVIEIYRKGTKIHGVISL